jgi:ankyrin repeat protein
MDLIDAVRYGDLGKIKWIIDQGDADVNHADENGWTPLYWTIRYDRVDICRLLLDSGADVNYKNNYGNNPLIIAVIDDRIDIIKLLLSRGANVNHKNKGGGCPIHYATFNSNIYQILSWRGAKRSNTIKTVIEIEGVIILINLGNIPRDILREIHTKWI